MCNKNPRKFPCNPYYSDPKQSFVVPKVVYNFCRQEKKIDIYSYGLLTIDAR